jgi:murein DD-endopeptidase MepM/ murein hydrolase activator NlpD
VPAKRGARRLKNKKNLARTGLLYAVCGIALMAVSVKSSNGYTRPVHVIPIVQTQPGPDIQMAALSEAPVTTLAPAARVVGPNSYKSAAVEVVALGKAAISSIFESKPQESEAASLDPTGPADATGELARHIVRVKSGDTLMDILLRAGVPGEEAEQAVSSLAEIFNPRKLQAGQDVTLIFGPADSVAGGVSADQTTIAGDLKAGFPAPVAKPSDASKAFLAVRLDSDVGREIAVNRGAEGGFSAVETEKKLTTEMSRSDGLIKYSLFDSAQGAGVPPKVMTEMISAFSYDVDFQRDIQPGDAFEVMYEKVVDGNGRLMDTGNIIYTKLTLSGTDLALYRYTTKDGVTEYFNQKGEGAQKALMRTPIDGARLTSGFGKRKHPILGYTRMHKGVDFAAPKGTPIFAAGTGTVREAGRHSGYGNYIEIRHDPEFSTAYGHLSRFAKGIHPGARVSQGQVIGYVGATGLATGPHLHYEVIRDHKKVNPLSVNLPTGHRLKGVDLAAFNAEKAKVDAAFAALPVDNKLASNQ